MELPHVEPLVDRLAEQLRALLVERGIESPAMVGIHTGGAWIAQELHKKLELTKPLGTLDISFYRDDFTERGLNPHVKPSKLLFNVEDEHVILIDDIIMSGRTIRAAMNELFDYGRPASIILASLIDVGGRELPVEPNCIGTHLHLVKHKRIKLRGPNPLTLEWGK